MNRKECKERILGSLWSFPFIVISNSVKDRKIVAWLYTAQQIYMYSF